MANLVRFTSPSSIKYFSIPSIPVDLLAEAAGRLIRFRESRGPGELDIPNAVVRTIAGRRGTRSDKELVALATPLAQRFYALLNHLADQGYSKRQASSILHGKDPKVLRAATRAPLIAEDKCLPDSRFHLATFLGIVREERSTDRTVRRKPRSTSPVDIVKAAEMRFGAQLWIAEVDPASLAPLHRYFLVPRPDDPRDMQEEVLSTARRGERFEVMNLASRLVALDYLLSYADLGGWLISREEGINHVRHADAFVRAAARAPLLQVHDFARYRFDPEPFLALVLQEAAKLSTA